MTTLLSDGSSMLLGECRDLALQYGNDYLSLHHFLLAFRNSDACTSSSRLSGSAAKQLIQTLSNHRLSPENSNTLPFSRTFEEVLKRSRYHRRITGNARIEPCDIYLSFIAHQLGNYPLYRRYLREKQIGADLWKRLQARLLCASFFRIPSRFPLAFL